MLVAAAPQGAPAARRHPQQQHNKYRRVVKRPASSSSSSTMSQATIDISGYSVTKDAKGKDYVVFIVKVRVDEYSWTVYRRFTQFRDLGEKLKRAIPDVPPCPPKRLFSMHSPEFLESRRVELLEWLRQLASIERVCQHLDFHDFLKADANVFPTAASAAAASPPGSPARPVAPVRHAASSTSSASSHASSKIGLRDFTLIKVVGKGSFGKVMMVRKKDDGRIYAMKVLRKSNIIRRNQVDHTKTERSVLGKIVHPFIVGLNYAFQSADKLYFVLDYCAGGELFFHLGREGRFSEARARFYACQMLLALQHLHTLDVIYRDLKPENVLLDAKGNVRLTDFGLSKENVTATASGAHSFCGTPEYLAPEVLNRTGHGRAVDWWSLGALLYEMVTGLPPFYSADRQQLFENIRYGRLEIPMYLSPEAASLLRGLLCRDPKKRLGSGDQSADAIKAHPFFKDVDWDAMLAGRVEPPWRPPVVGSLDTSMFDTEFTNLPVFTPPSAQSHSEAVNFKFENFTFIAPNIMGGGGGGGAAAAPVAPTHMTPTDLEEVKMADEVPTSYGGGFVDAASPDGVAGDLEIGGDEPLGDDLDADLDMGVPHYAAATPSRTSHLDAMAPVFVPSPFFGGGAGAAGATAYMGGRNYDYAAPAAYPPHPNVRLDADSFDLTSMSPGDAPMSVSG